MKVVAAPAPFKGALGPAAAAAAIAAGARAAGADVREVPMADGGEGTL
ncbi:MAG: glycerate kinase, partial [Miltoncostaeaceae bacterium]